MTDRAGRKPFPALESEKHISSGQIVWEPTVRIRSNAFFGGRYFETHYLTVHPQLGAGGGEAPGEGGEIQLRGQGANPTWFIDVLDTTLRLRTSDPTGVIIFGIDGEVARVTADGLQQPTPASIVKARAQNLTGSTISTTEAAEMVAVLAIPTHWNTYDIEASLTAYVFESGTLTANRNVVNRIRLTDAAGAVLGVANAELDDAAPNRIAVPILGYITGQSATGNISVVFTADITGDSGQASWDNGTLLATAYRTT